MGYKVKDLDALNKITANLKYETECSTKTKSDIAREVGITTGALSQYLSGAAFPNLVTLRKICKVIDISADTILDI